MMRKVTFIFCLLLAAASLSAAKVYYVNSNHWSKVKAYMWTNGGEMSWPGKDMIHVDINCTKGEVLEIDYGTYKNIIFNNGAGTQTSDLVIDPENVYWYNEMCFASLAEIEDYVPPVGGVGVPAQCEDVMLQAFYWDSNQDKGYGNTRWTTLTAQAEEIGATFDLVWLPPSSYSTGGLGYHPYQYSNQNSSMGTTNEMQKLIAALHKNGAKVIADIVINHCYSKSSWCNFYEMNFGRFGKYQPLSSWIAANDEVNTTPSAGGCYQCSLSTAHNDDGENWDGARDWDHLNKDVQAMCEAYLQWMMDNWSYDGFRYDMVKGYNRKHISDYNMVAKPYLSVMEYWDGDKNVLKNVIEQAKKNTMTFDFAAKYNVFGAGIYSKNYNKLRTEGMRSVGYSKYAVTFIDNHDTFARSDNKDVAGKTDGSSIKDKDLMMRCHAYLLSMPGVPCVFYPHWVTYKEEIQKMVNARKMAGVHSESKVEDAVTDSGKGYKATVTGKYGKVVLYLGTAASQTAPQGYETAIKGDSYAMYYEGGGPVGLEQLRGNRQQTNGVKVMNNGQMIIQVGENNYDIFGNKVQ